LRNRNGVNLTRWTASQAIEAKYWQRVCNDPEEFLRILYEKQICLNRVTTNVPEAVSIASGEKKRVIEVGIGSLGIGVASMLAPPGSWEIVGLDPQPPTVPKLSPMLMAVYREALTLPLTYLQRSGEKTGLPSDSFDLAICYNVLDHTKNWSDILFEIHRILKPGGYFILGLDVVSLLSKARWYFWLRHAKKNDGNIIAHPFKFTAMQAERMLHEHGFNIIYLEKTKKDKLHRFVGKACRLTSVGQKIQ
jgi:SAM-dependent methyltransferase